MSLLVLRNGSIVNLTVLSCCISNFLLPSLKGLCNDQEYFLLRDMISNAVIKCPGFPLLRHNCV